MALATSPQPCSAMTVMTATTVGVEVQVLTQAERVEQAAVVQEVATAQHAARSAKFWRWVCPCSPPQAVQTRQSKRCIQCPQTCSPTNTHGGHMTRRQSRSSNPHMPLGPAWSHPDCCYVTVGTFARLEQRSLVQLTKQIRAVTCGFRVISPTGTYTVTDEK